MIRVACIGGAHVDVKARVDGAVVPGTSNPATVSRTPGGVACNVARSLVRLGVEVRLISAIGDDALGDGLRALLADEGIDATGLRVHAGRPTASYLAVLDGGGALAVGIADMAIYDLMGPGWIEGALEGASDCDLWVVDANLPTAGIAAVAEAKRHRILAADPVSVEKATRLIGSLGRCDLVFPDRAEAAVLAGAEGAPGEMADRIAAQGVAGVVVSLGADGMWVRSGGAGRPVPAVAPERVVEVTGAGDAGIAGWVYALATEREDPALWAAAASSLAVETGDSVRSDLTADLLAERAGR